jgi:hypothetical protein
MIIYGSVKGMSSKYCWVESFLSPSKLCKSSIRTQRVLSYISYLQSVAQSSEVRVVVQQLPAVELAEDGGERLIQHCTSQQLSSSQKEGMYRN